LGIFGYQGPDALPRWVDFVLLNACALFILNRYWIKSSESTGHLLIAGAIVIVVGNYATWFFTKHKAKKAESGNYEQETEDVTD